MNLMSLINMIGGRKALAMLTMLVVGIAFAYLKGDVPPGVLVLLQTIFSGYIAGNVGEHFAKRTPAEVAKDNADVAEQMAVVAQSIQRSNEALSYLVEYVNHVESRFQQASGGATNKNSAAARNRRAMDDVGEDE